MAAMTMSAKYDHYAPRVERSAGPRAVVGRTVALPARAGRDRSPVRLTRRGRRLARVMVIVVALVVTLMLMVVGHVGSSQADVGPVVVATSTVVVQPGQTLWAIALEVAPDADARDTQASTRTWCIRVSGSWCHARAELGTGPRCQCRILATRPTRRAYAQTLAPLPVGLYGSHI